MNDTQAPAVLPGDYFTHQRTGRQFAAESVTMRGPGEAASVSVKALPDDAFRFDASHPLAITNVARADSRGPVRWTFHQHDSGAMSDGSNRVGERVFRRGGLRFCVCFDGYGAVPIASVGDDKPVFETVEPKRIGDEAIIRAEGQRRRVRLLKSSGHAKDTTYLVDMGPA